MKKVLDFLKESNRYKHLIGGFFVGLCSLTPSASLYSAIVAASCLELKDVLYKNKWDWIDWAFTVVGGGISTILLYFIYDIIGAL